MYPVDCKTKRHEKDLEKTLIPSEETVFPPYCLKRQVFFSKKKVLRLAFQYPIPISRNIHIKFKTEGRIF